MVGRQWRAEWYENVLGRRCRQDFFGVFSSGGTGRKRCSPLYNIAGRQMVGGRWRS